MALVEELATMSEKIKVEEAKLLEPPSFSINRLDKDMGVTFAGLLRV